MYDLTPAEARLIARSRQRRAGAPGWTQWLIYGLTCAALAVATLSVYSVYGPGIQDMLASRFETTPAQPGTPQVTAPAMPVTQPAPPAAPQVIYVAQPADAAPPAVVVPQPVASGSAAPATIAPAAAPAAPQVVYIQTTNGATVATGSGTVAADGSAPTGVCALARGARRCGR